MGEGDQRSSKRTEKLDSQELRRLLDRSAQASAEDAAATADAAAITAPATDADESSFGDLREDTETPAARAARGSEPPLTARTSTLDDPLTTSLLAEIARRDRS